MLRSCVLGSLACAWSQAATLDCGHLDRSNSLAVCCDAQLAWSSMESAGGCGGHGATEAQCSAASDLCQQCRTAVAARADTETEDGAAEGALLSSLDVGFLELHCVLPQWHDACQSSVADLGFALLLLAGGLLMLLAAGGLLLFDWYALPGLVSAAKPLPPSQAAAASKVGQSGAHKRDKRFRSSWLC